MKKYINDHAFKALETHDFKACILKHFADIEAIKAVDWDMWLYTPGPPPIENEFDDTLAVRSVALASRVRERGGKGLAASDLDGWSARQVMHFLDESASSVEGGQGPLTLETMKEIDAAYELTKSKNAEIRFRWYLLSIKCSYQAVSEKLVKFLREQGRMKYVRPLYRAMYANEGSFRELAVNTFKESRTSYHPVVAKMLAKDLHIS